MAEYAKHYRVYFKIECEVYTIIIVIIILIIHFGCIFNENNDVAIKVFAKQGIVVDLKMNIYFRKTFFHTKPQKGKVYYRCQKKKIVKSFMFCFH